MSTDGARLLAAGIQVKLKDGVSRRLVLDMEALVVIEEMQGSLSAYLGGLNRGFKGSVITSTRTGLTAGLSHYRDQFGRPQFPAEMVAKLMDFEQIKVYGKRLDEAWEEAIPSTKTKTSKPSGPASVSPGKSFIEGPPSTTVAATEPSGA